MTKIRNIEALNATIKDYTEGVEIAEKLIHSKPAKDGTIGYDSFRELACALQHVRNDAVAIMELIEFVKLLKTISETDFSFLDKHSAITAVGEDTIHHMAYYNSLTALRKAWDTNSEADITALGKSANRKHDNDEAEEYLHR